MKRRDQASHRLRTIVAAVCMLMIAGCLVGASARERGKVHEVAMQSVSFGPEELAITVGDTVMWRNKDIVRHNAVRPQVFDSGELQPGETFSWVPADTGTYIYRCTIHRRMRGKLTVTR